MKKNMNRKEFITQVGVGALAALAPLCLSGLSSCKKTDTTATKVDFTVDTSSGQLATNGGYIISNGVIVARTMSGNFLAVSVACTHEGATVNYNSSANNFVCPRHGAQFNSAGAVTMGPAQSSLTKYNTTLTGTSLHVYS